MKVWFKVDETLPSYVELENEADVVSLRKAIKKECPNYLEGVDHNSLQVFAADDDTSKDTQLDNDDLIPTGSS